jgi:hypothetical protein
MLGPMRRVILIAISVAGGLAILALLGMVAAFVLFLVFAGEPEPQH